MTKIYEYKNMTKYELILEIIRLKMQNDILSKNNEKKNKNISIYEITLRIYIAAKVLEYINYYLKKKQNEKN